MPHDFIPGEPPEIWRPLRLLVVISSPPDLPEAKRLDTARERRTIEGALRQLMESGQMEVDFVDEAAQEVIRKTLLARDYHLVHYTGHGGFDPEADGGQGDGYLVMEDGHDRTKKVYSADVARLFASTTVTRPSTRLCARTTPCASSWPPWCRPWRKRKRGPISSSLTTLRACWTRNWGWLTRGCRTCWKRC